MRFASLNLERYGHFEDRELKFRTGDPDMHVIYGSNEAGKTTSLCAISDLLFGFPTRSPFNFMFDYSLLRIGAVVEDESETFAFRRKKGASGTLIDDEDRPLEEARLNAMLRGLNRDSFSSSFSLTQEGLRAGGHAMIEARDDVGQALFAAGSGLTGISTELSLLEEEADAIWAPRAAARRSFTQAERDFADSVRQMRENSLKPKIWLDAKAAVANAKAALDEVRKMRDDMLAQLREAERLRRIAPTIQVRTNHLSDLDAHEATVDISPLRDEAAQAAIADAATARQDIATARRLSDEIISKIAEIAPAAEFLDHADEIDALGKTSSVIDKTTADLEKLRSDRKIGVAIIERLQGEVGEKGTVPPTRPESSALRHLAAAHADDASALKQLMKSEEGLVDRKQALTRDDRDEVEANSPDALISAVDKARALGSDTDARCNEAKQKAERAAIELKQSLARLSPWNGDIETLLSLPTIGQEEIDDIRNKLAELEKNIEEDRKAAARARDGVAAAALQIDGLTSGAAVSGEEIEAARAKRTEAWIPIRKHVFSGTPLVSSDDAISGFEAAIEHTDVLSDRRYASADESSQLVIHERMKASYQADAEQADKRVACEQQRLQTTTTNWFARLKNDGFPELLPARLNAWMAQRDATEEAYHDAQNADRDAESILERRDKCRSELIALFKSDKEAPDDPDLSPILTYAEKVRSILEDKAEEKRQQDRDLAQVETDLRGLERRREKLGGFMSARSKDWRDRLASLRLSFEIGAATATIDVLDELRDENAKQADLVTKAGEMEREINAHDERVTMLANVVGLKETDGSADALMQMVTRLAAARADANSRSTFTQTLETRKSELEEAAARLRAAEQIIEPLMAETGSETTAALSDSLEASRSKRATKEAVTAAEDSIISDGDGFSLEELLEKAKDIDPDFLASKAHTLAAEIEALNDQVNEAATLHGDAMRSFANLEIEDEPAAGPAADAEQARAEMTDLAEDYILKRAQAVTLRWAIDRYREQNQDPLLLRAGELFSTLTIGRYVSLQIDNESKNPRILGLRDDGRTAVDVGGMSEGTTDQLFLALRLAAVEQSVRSGTRLPFLADDLFVNFDDERSEAGFHVLGELAKSTQVLFFTHHPHLAKIAREVVGADKHSLCSLG